MWLIVFHWNLAYFGNALDFFLAGGQDGRTTVLEKERTKVDTPAEDTEDEGILGAVKNAVG